MENITCTFLYFFRVLCAFYLLKIVLFSNMRVAALITVILFWKKYQFRRKATALSVILDEYVRFYFINGL